MTELKSNVLILGERPRHALNISVDIFYKLSELEKDYSQSIYDVLVLPILVGLSEDFHRFYKSQKLKNPGLQLILIAPSHSMIQDLQEAINRLQAFKVLESIHVLDFELHILHALEQSQQIKQNLQLESLVRDQNEKLKVLYRTLEERVENRKNFLQEARKKTNIASLRWEAIKNASEIIYKARSISEMEQELTEALSETLQLLTTRILFHPHDNIFKEQNPTKKSYSSLQAPIYHVEPDELSSEKKSSGSVFFLRSKSQPFSRDEVDFLFKITEVIALAVDRLDKLHQSEHFKELWAATFNAVSDPVSIINSKYEIIQNNLAYQSKAKSNEALSGLKCHQVLFKSDSPCTHCHLGKTFRTEKAERTFEVHSHSISMGVIDETVFVNQYHDLTDQLRMEKQIIDSAKLAELGTIGSSIAHELNNPLGGMLSFVQLIKMDLKPDNKIYPDIVEMEDGVRRCRDIVQNLLGFTRSSDKDSLSDLNLNQLVDKIVKIMEIQTKPNGIDLKFEMPSQTFNVKGRGLHLSQAIQNLLQNSIQGIFEKAKIQKDFHGIIEVRISSSDGKIEISILDNGSAFESMPDLGLSVARQIIHDHQGLLEISNAQKQLRMAKITFSSPVLTSKSPNS